MTAFLLFLRPHLRWLLPVLGMVVLVLGIYAKGRSDGKEACQRAQEAAERKADAKAAVVAKRAHERTQKATAKIRERTEEVADEVERDMDAARVGCPDVQQPASVRDAGREAVERARRALSPS